MTKKRIEKSGAEWRKELSPEQFAVCREKGTERAFTGKFYDSHEQGIYRCVCCGNELFDSDAKFDSGTGWPSFFTPIATDAVKTAEDRSHGTVRTEVMCAACDAHLGHVFPDGPDPTGLRFCINSVSLDLDKEQEE